MSTLTKFAAVALLTTLGGWACQHGGPAVTTVDKAKGELSIYSTGDRRSAMADTAKAKDVRQAEEKLKSHLRQNRGDVDALVALASVQVASGNLEAAEKNCFTALRLDLKNRDARIILAQIAYRRGNYDLASIFLSAVGGVGGEQSKDGNVLNMLALIELARDNNTGAMMLFKRAIQLDADNVAARMNLGVLLLKYRQLAQAAVEFERVLKVMPKHADAKMHLAIVLASRGQNDDARKLLREVLDADEKNPLALYNLAVLQRDGEQYDDALDNLKEYMRSTRGKAADNDQVFALIDDIQRSQAEKGQSVSDAEIQTMAQQMAQTQQEQGQQVAKNDAPAVKAASTQPGAAKKPTPAAQPQPKAQPKTTEPKAEDTATAAADDSLVIPDNVEPAGGEEIDDLEKQLAH